MVEAHVPDEIWLRILEVGIHNKILTPKDVCSFSICSKRFNRLADDNILWSIFLTLSFTDSLNHRCPLSYKSLYEFTYEFFKKKALELLTDEQIVRELQRRQQQQMSTLWQLQQLQQMSQLRQLQQRMLYMRQQQQIPQARQLQQRHMLQLRQQQMLPRQQQRQEQHQLTQRGQQQQRRRLN